MNKSIKQERLDDALLQMFSSSASLPPVLTTERLQALAARREQHYLLFAVSLLSALASSCTLLAAWLLRVVYPLAGQGIVTGLLVGWLGAGLLAAALLRDGRFALSAPCAVDRTIIQGK